jgi:alditol oxidase
MTQYHLASPEAGRKPVIAGTNWARNYTYQAREVVSPGSLNELQELVGRSPALRALGSRHSFNDLADTKGTLVSLASMPSKVAVDPARGVATVSAGASYGAVAAELERQGWALANLASLPHISVAGAVSTGTHGSSLGNGSLADAVTAVELVGADGELHRFARDRDPDFPGSVVALGALGVVTSVDLRIEPTYDVAQHVYEAMALATALDRFDEIMGAGYSVSMFTTWRHPRIDQIWVKRRTGQPEPGQFLFDAVAAPADRQPIAHVPATHTTPQRGVPGPWLARLPHFRLEFTPSAGDELQSEYLVPVHHAVPAIEAVARLADRIAPLLQVSEIRTVRRDDLWLSPAYGQDVVALHFTWVPNQPAVTALLPDLEAALEPYAARPHWGKLFTLGANRLSARYERLPDFVRLAERLDPRGAFRNDYLGTVDLLDRHPPRTHYFEEVVASRGRAVGEATTSGKERARGATATWKQRPVRSGISSAPWRSGDGRPRRWSSTRDSRRTTQRRTGRRTRRRSSRRSSPR